MFGPWQLNSLHGICIGRSSDGDYTWTRFRLFHQFDRILPPGSPLSRRDGELPARLWPGRRSWGKLDICSVLGSNLGTIPSELGAIHPTKWVDSLRESKLSELAQAGGLCRLQSKWWERVAAQPFSNPEWETETNDSLAMAY